jgi:hypothetical protein
MDGRRSRRAWRTTASLVGTTVCLAVACVRYEPPLATSLIDSEATFVAHSVHGGLAIDRSDGVPMTRIEARGRGGEAPTFVVLRDDAAVGGLWLRDPAAVVARRGLTLAAPVTLEIEPAWVDDAIRLRLASGAGRLHTGPFARVDARVGLGELSRAGQTNLDLRGVYRATVFDAGDTAVGWFEVRAPSPDTPRVFQGRLPPLPLAGPALSVALGSELDWIEDHTVDVYRGTGRDRLPVTPGR